MNSAKIAIFQRNEEFLSELTNYFDETEGFKVCAIARTGDTAVEELKSSAPDVALIDPMLKGIDGIKLLDYIKDSQPACLPIMVSDFDSEKIVNLANNHGAAYFFVKPITPQNIGERIMDMLHDRVTVQKINELREKRRPISIEERVSTIFTTIGIPPHIKGYSYLREGIKMAVTDQTIINRVTKELYPRIAAKFETTSSKVERAIRHAIEVAWNRGRTEAISSVFGARVYIGNERPTNSEFIALVADKLLLEYFG